MDCDDASEEGDVPWVTVLNQNFGQSSGGDVLMNELSTDNRADPQFSKRRPPGEKRGKDMRRKASQWLKRNTAPPPK